MREDPRYGWKVPDSHNPDLFKPSLEERILGGLGLVWQELLHLLTARGGGPSAPGG